MQNYNDALTDEQRDIASKTAKAFTNVHRSMIEAGFDPEAVVSGVCSSFLTLAQEQLGPAGLADWLRNMAELIDVMSRQPEELN